MTTTWKEIEQLALEAGAKYPELVAAQWALESGWGKYTSGKNNFFGLKGPGNSTKTQEWDGQKFITIEDEFLNFSSPADCVNYLVTKWYKDYKNYKGVNNARDIKSAAKALIQEGYATDPKYPEKLLALLTTDSNKDSMTNFSQDKFFDFAFFADKANPKHKAAYDDLYKEILALKPELLTDEANWVRIYRSTPPISPSTGGVLNVPYFSQRDNYRDAARTCFSSSCAMLCEFLKPGTLPGAKGDDKYVQQVFKRGDSTDASVQIQTLAYFGIKSRFATNMTFATLDSLLSQGIPVPIGILHHGPASAPSGGGHWICVIGKEGNNYIVHDPWGEIDNASGTYMSTNGKSLKYSKSLLKSRWTVEGDGSGWGVIATK